MERQQHANVKDKVRDELREFLVVTLFFTLVLGVFNIYRRQILREAGVSYPHDGITLVEALILAKIVMIGEALNLKLVDASRRSIFEVAVLRSILFAAPGVAVHDSRTRRGRTDPQNGLGGHRS